LPNGPAAIIVAAVLCTLLAAIEAADKVAWPPPRPAHCSRSRFFATQFLPDAAAVDFPSMAVALAPWMLTAVSSWAAANRPARSLVCVYFAFASNIEIMTYDAAAFLNSSLAILVGIAVAVVCSHFLPRGPRLRARRSAELVST